MDVALASAETVETVLSRAAPTRISAPSRHDVLGEAGTAAGLAAAAAVAARAVSRNRADGRCHRSG